MADDDLDQWEEGAEGEAPAGDAEGAEAAMEGEDLASEWENALEDQGDGAGEGDLADEWAAALASDEAEQVGDDKRSLYQTASDANFKDMTAASKAPRTEGQRHELDFILDIPLDVSAELGRTRLLINELLQLGQGSVIELNKLAGEPLEVYVNGKLIARGEAVVINEKFGVRLSDIISPHERVKQLS